MEMGLELMTFSTFIFGALIMACFKMLKRTYTTQEIVQKKISNQQRSADNRAFNQELHDISSDFEYKLSVALRGELNKAA